MVEGADITTLGDIDGRWLAEALGASTTPVVEQRSIGTGQVGENVRFALSWPDEARSDLPRSVVGKFPSLDETSRATAAATGSYVKEIGFYRDLQHSVEIRTPHLFRMEEALDQHAFLLLMEDITPAAQGDQIEGCRVGEATLAVAALGGLHGPHWGQPPSLDWMSDRTPERGEELAGIYQMVVGGFCERYERRLDDDVRRLALEFGAHLGEWYRSFRTAVTVVHGDYRLDNLLFGTGPGAPPLTVVDWQTTGIGHGPSDAAYFVGAGLTPADRQANEAMLFETYCRELRAAADRSGCTLDDAELLWHDYQLGAASGLVMAVVASMIVGQTDRGDEMFCVMAERHADQMSSLDTLELIATT